MQTPRPQAVEGCRRRGIQSGVLPRGRRPTEDAAHAIRIRDEDLRPSVGADVQPPRADRLSVQLSVDVLHIRSADDSQIHPEGTQTLDEALDRGCVAPPVRDPVPSQSKTTASTRRSRRRVVSTDPSENITAIA
jgi:hypothetical protein